MLFIIGMFVGIFFLEPILINFIYFSNVDFFCDFILTKKNYKKLETKFKKKNNKVPIGDDIYEKNF